MTNRNPEKMTEQRTAETSAQANLDQDQRNLESGSRQNVGHSRLQSSLRLSSLGPSLQRRGPGRPRDVMSFPDDNKTMLIEEYQVQFDLLLQLKLRKLRVETRNKWKRQVERIVKQINHLEMIKISTKNEEIGAARDLNSLLDQKVKSLFAETQVWKDIAQKNVAMAKAMRSFLEQSAAASIRNIAGAEAQSSCHGAQDQNQELCRNCSKETRDTMILPCKHLCLCWSCSEILSSCPICHSQKISSVRICKFDI